MTQSQSEYHGMENTHGVRSACLKTTRALILVLLILNTGCANTRASNSTNPGPPPKVETIDPPSSKTGANTPTKPNKKNAGTNQPTNRAQAAVEGAMVGAIVGGQAGPIGAAVGAGTMLIYGAITGKVPFGKPGGRGSKPGKSPGERQREQEIESQIENEIKRQDNLESQIEEELQKQEALLEEIDRRESENLPVPPSSSSPKDADRPPKTSPESQLATLHPSNGNKHRENARELRNVEEGRKAPLLPIERHLPLAIFAEKEQLIPAGSWNNKQPLRVSVRSLDADEDGMAEEIRYYSKEDGTLLRKERDRDYNGSMDTWSEYENGAVARISLDENGDEKPDEWQTYSATGQMIRREIDRDNDGSKDAFFYFEGDSLVREEHDLNADGRIDRVSYFENRVLERAEEDFDRDGVMDTWLTYQEEGSGREILQRVEKDTNTDGLRDTFEDYEKIGDSILLKRRQEDKNADGKIDVTSLYEKGKLTQREISDPNLVPL